MPRVFKLTMLTPLPPRDTILKNFKNKNQLNRLLCQHILNDDDFLCTLTQSQVLVVTGEDHVPIQVYKGHKSRRLDLTTSLEEADNIIAQ